MSLSDAIGKSRWPGGLTKHWSRSLFAGSTCAIVSIAFNLSYGALVFSDLLSPWLSYGVAVTFLTTAIAAFVVALRSSLPFTIAGPDSSTSAVTAALAGAVAERVAASGSTDHVLATALIVIAFSTATTGLVLCALGVARGSLCHLAE
jgi:SulP family sulfate permease